MKIQSLLVCISILFMLAACSSKRVPSVKVEGTNTSSIMEIVKQPIYSVNLIRKKIPENLKQLTEVYNSPNDCDALLQELELLNVALGEDLIDKPNSKEGVFTLHLGQMLSKEVESNIPFNSIIKRLSGARKHEKERLSAQVRGKFRRSYLQGWSDAMQCQPPIVDTVERAEAVEDVDTVESVEKIINKNSTDSN